MRMKSVTNTPKALVATGRRKTSVARVAMNSGTGNIFVNSRPFKEYFPMETEQIVVRLPLKVTELDDRFDITVNVEGGGISSQSEAIQLGISRALLTFSSELRQTLKPLKLLRRDARVKERKKYGQRGARARFQYSKR